MNNASKTQEYHNQQIKKYDQAVALFDKDEFDACQKACPDHLADPTLTPYWQLENHLLFMSASGDWYEVEKRRKAAENIYRGILNKTGPESSKTIQKALRDLRENLDKMKEG